MKISVVFPILLCASLSAPVVTFAQITLSSVTVRAGIIRTQWDNDPIYAKYLWSFYPEIQAGGTFIIPYLSWGLSWGYWTDGIDHTLPVMDMVTYSQSAHIVAARIGFEPTVLTDHLPVVITLFVGAAEHFSKLSYIGGTDFAGNRGENSTEQLTTGFVGIGASYPVVSRLSLQLEGLQYIPFGDSWHDNAQKNRRAFKFGLAVKL
jgi:hypothetical protein